MKWTASLVRKLCVVSAVAAIGLSAAVTHVRAADGDSEISVIMKKAFKGAGGPKKPGAGGQAPAGGEKPKKPSLVQKAVEGTATPDEVKTLLTECEALGKAKPPKGEQKDWDTRCSDLVTSVKAIQSGDKTAGPKLKAAANCKACHDLHKES